MKPSIPRRAWSEREACFFGARSAEYQTVLGGLTAGRAPASHGFLPPPTSPTSGGEGRERADARNNPRIKSGDGHDDARKLMRSRWRADEITWKCALRARAH